MPAAEDDRIEAIGRLLNDQKRPLKERFRALFTLKNIGGPVAIEYISKCFNDPSALLKHELAYCLGQVQDVRAIPILISVLQDTNQNPMVRHEAGEALGAIGSPEALCVLQEFSTDPVIEVAETCQLAANRIHWLQDPENQTERLPGSQFDSVDPAPASVERDVEVLRSILIDDTKSLFDRYRAMFSLRDLRSSKSIEALVKGFSCSSALLRHEVAFVLGQMQEKESLPYLIEVLKNEQENEMVRHECAEALGSIASDECISVLEEYLRDEKRVVRESCEVALDMCEYENSPEFQYADSLFKVFH